MRKQLSHSPDERRSVVVIVADGARPDALAEAINAGALPDLKHLRDEGGLHTITSAFPSVTGPAYTPFLMGRYPGPVGLPGLRWYDRARTTCRLPGNSRSYVGPEMRMVDQDLSPDSPTIFELVPRSVAALNVIGRGLNKRARLGRGLRFIARTTLTHFRGNVRGWLDIDRDIGHELAGIIAKQKPNFVYAALTGVDKTSHAAGHSSPIVTEALGIVNDVVAQIRSDAERDGRWEHMHLWIVSDHGHSPVLQHEDLAGLLASTGLKTIAHPWIYRTGGEAAVMVSGNAMAHVYLSLEKRERPFWSRKNNKWREIAELLLARASVDLMLLPFSERACEIHGRGRGHARLMWSERCINYIPKTGDPLGIGEQWNLDAHSAYAACIESDYPDALVQIANLVGAQRSGEIILSASRNWDFRARYEPIPHVSSHGALHREHMLVPLLVNRPVSRKPRRTVDVMPSALGALGIESPPGLDGVSFLLSDNRSRHSSVDRAVEVVRPRRIKRAPHTAAGRE